MTKEISTVVRPARLKEGDVIGVVSPARWMPDNELKTSVRNLRGMGFKVQIYDQNHSRLHQYAGSDQERHEAVESAFGDPSISAIVFAKGGYGTLRIVDNIDYEVIKENPKIIVGYSDTTALLASVHIQAGLVTDVTHGRIFVRDRAVSLP